MSSLHHFDKVVAAKLDACDNASEMLRVLHKEFDLSKPLGMTTQIAFRIGLRTAIRMIDAPVNDL
jgi:hypothetical protein